MRKTTATSSLITLLLVLRLQPAGQSAERRPPPRPTWSPLRWPSCSPRNPAPPRRTPPSLPRTYPPAVSYARSPDLTATATPSPATPPPTPMTRRFLGEPTWQDNAGYDQEFLPIRERQHQNRSGRQALLALTGRNANGWVGWSLTYAQPSANFYLETTFRTRDCSGSDLYGTGLPRQ